MSQENPTNIYVIINGGGGVGKDEFIKQCSLLIPNVHNISTIDFVKEIAILCGWNQEKNDKSRKFLSDLKDAMTIYDDIPVKKILERISNLNDSLVFIHCREPKEVEKLKNLLGAKTLLVKNKNIEKIDTNHADRDVENYTYNFILHNDGTIEDLIEKCKGFLVWLAMNSETKFNFEL